MVNVLQEPVNKALAFQVRIVMVRDVATEAPQHILSHDEQVRYTAQFARGNNKALADEPDGYDQFDNSLIPADQKELERINQIAGAIGSAAVLEAGMVKPTYAEVREVIERGPYALALYNVILAFSGVVRDPK